MAEMERRMRHSPRTPNDVRDRIIFEARLRGGTLDLLLLLSLHIYIDMSLPLICFRIC